MCDAHARPLPPKPRTCRCSAAATAFRRRQRQRSAPVLTHRARRIAGFPPPANPFATQARSRAGSLAPHGRQPETTPVRYERRARGPLASAVQAIGGGSGRYRHAPAPIIAPRNDRPTAVTPRRRIVTRVTRSSAISAAAAGNRFATASATPSSIMQSICIESLETRHGAICIFRSETCIYRPPTK